MHTTDRYFAYFTRDPHTYPSPTTNILPEQYAFCRGRSDIYISCAVRTWGSHATVSRTRGMLLAPCPLANVLLTSIGARSSTWFLVGRADAIKCCGEVPNRSHVPPFSIRAASPARRPPHKPVDNPSRLWRSAIQKAETKPDCITHVPGNAIVKLYCHHVLFTTVVTGRVWYGVVTAVQNSKRLQVLKHFIIIQKQRFTCVARYA